MKTKLKRSSAAPFKCLVGLKPTKDHMMQYHNAIESKICTCLKYTTVYVLEGYGYMNCNVHTIKSSKAGGQDGLNLDQFEQLCWGANLGIHHHW